MRCWPNLNTNRIHKDDQAERLDELQHVSAEHQPKLVKGGCDCIGDGAKKPCRGRALYGPLVVLDRAVPYLTYKSCRLEQAQRRRTHSHQLFNAGRSLMAMRWGAMASGTLRLMSICSSPLLKVAPVTSIWSARVKLRLNGWITSP